jgi:hypothetical protein
VTFLYTGQSREDIPRNVTHVKVVDPTVKVIGKYAFTGCSQLRNVELCEGELERIDRGHSMTANPLQASASHPQSKRLGRMHSIVAIS